VALGLGIGTLYVGGVAQLLLLTGAPLATTVAAGVLPFLVGDLIKVFLALVLLERFQSTSLGGT
jgi:biotin transporter BioY